MRRRPVVPVLATAALLVLGACSSDTPQENSDQACAAAEELATALQDLDGTLTPDATVDEIRQARDAVDEAQGRLDDATEDVAQDRVDALDQAWDQLDDAIGDVDGDATVADAVDGLRDDVAEVRTARDELVDAISC